MLKQKPQEWYAPLRRVAPTQQRTHRARWGSSVGAAVQLPPAASRRPESERTRRPPRGKTGRRRHPPGADTGHPLRLEVLFLGSPDHSGVRSRGVRVARLGNRVLPVAHRIHPPPPGAPQPSRPSRPDAEASRYKASVCPASLSSRRPRPRSLLLPRSRLASSTISSRSRPGTRAAPRSRYRCCHRRRGAFLRGACLPASDRNRKFRGRGRRGPGDRKRGRAWSPEPEPEPGPELGRRLNRRRRRRP